jgi:preprotein translocase subunit SecG
MYLFVVSLHVMLCLFLLVVILLQPGKGGDVGSAFGGGGAGSMFGPRGPVSLLSRATTVVAVLFMITSVTLSIYSNRARQADADVSGEIERLQRESLEKQGGSGDETTVPDEGSGSLTPEEDPQD